MGVGLNKMKKPKKIGEIKMEIDKEVVTFKVWCLNSEYWATYNNPHIIAKIGKHKGSYNLANLIFTTELLKKLDGKIIFNTLPKKVMELATKEAILLRLE